MEVDSEAFCGHLLDPLRWKSVLATNGRVLAYSLFLIWPCGKNTGILHGPRQNDWAKIQLILAQSSWQPVKNTGNLQRFAAFWDWGCVRQFWPHLFAREQRACRAASVLCVEACVSSRNAIHFAGLAYSTFNVTRIWHVQFCASALFGQIELKN